MHDRYSSAPGFQPVPAPMSIPYGRQSIDDVDVEAVAAVLRSDWLTQGPAVEAFENELAAVTGAPYAVAFASGTGALHAAAFAAGIGTGDEVVTSAITFAASANCAAPQGVLALRSCDIVHDYVSSLIATCALICRTFGALATVAHE